MLEFFRYTGAEFIFRADFVADSLIRLSLLDEADDESLVLQKILLRRDARRSFLCPPPFSAFLPALPVVVSAARTFSLFSTPALDLKDLLLTYGGSFEVASKEKRVDDFSALLALRGEGGGSKLKDDSVVVAPIGGAVCG